MTAADLREKLSLEVLSEADDTREVTGGYAGDLLSWVMGRAGADTAWVTIMTNVNIVAVATLADVAAVIVAEGARPDESVIETARIKGVNLYCSEKPVFELCAAIAGML